MFLRLSEHLEVEDAGRCRHTDPPTFEDNESKLAVVYGMNIPALQPTESTLMSASQNQHNTGLDARTHKCQDVDMKYKLFGIKVTTTMLTFLSN